MDAEFFYVFILFFIYVLGGKDNGIFGIYKRIFKKTREFVFLHNRKIGG